MSGAERIDRAELLAARVKQLQTIADRLERLEAIHGDPTLVLTVSQIRDLRNDVADMIRAAEAERQAF